MQIRRPLVTSAAASLLLLAMWPLPAPIYMNVPLDESFKTSVKLSHAVLCDGSVRLEPGLYELKIRSLGDGTVRATLSGNGKTGHANGKVQGHDGIVVQGGLQPGQANSVQKVEPAPGSANKIVVQGGNQPGAADGIIIQGGKQPGAANAMIIHWSNLGFTPQSPSSVQQVGNQMNLLLKGHGNNQILIGLHVPAAQKVREAAAAPVH